MANSTSTPLPLMDIHLQSPPSAWPLAWGWWLIIFSICITLTLLIYYCIKARQKKKALNEAKQALTSLTTLSEINTLLRRAALSYFPREHIAPLTGRAWLSFLDAQLPKKHQGFIALSDLWQKGLFSLQGLSEEEFKTCFAQANIWLKEALPPKNRKTKEIAHV